MPKTTNAERQRERIESKCDTLISRLHTAIREYGIQQQGDPMDQQGWQMTVRDALVEIRHICDAEGLDYGAADKAAYPVYCEEIHGPALPPKF